MIKLAHPKCPKCDNGVFAATVIEPVDSNFKLTAIHCNKCGAVIGIQDFYNVGARLNTLAKKLRVNLDD